MLVIAAAFDAALVCDSRIICARLRGRPSD